MVQARQICCVAVLVAFATILTAAQAVYESTPKTMTATIAVIEKDSRVVTLKTTAGSWLHVRAPDEMEGFNTLKVGDQVTASYFEAVAVNVRKPGDPEPPGEPTTVVQRKERAPGSETRRQQTFRFTVRSVDSKTPSLTVSDPQGHIVTLAVENPQRLDTLRVGDTVDVTYYESLLVSLSRPPK